jgi:hypothetical protein
MIAFGGAVGGLGFILLALTHNFATFLLVYVGVLSLGMNAGFSHGVIAMSLTSMGFSVGGAVIVPGIAYIVLNLGWRSAAVISGLTLIAVVIPMSLVMRRSPESMGLLPDGDLEPRPARGHPSDTGSPGLARHLTTADFTAREAIRTPAYWLLAIATGLRMSAVTGVFVHLVPLVVWKGQSEAAGAFIVAYVSLASIPLKVFLGWTGDRWAIQNILGITGVLGAISLVILLLGGGQMWQLIIFATLFAAPMSGGSITWAIVGDFFGRKSFATLRGGALGISSLMSMGVPVFAGWVYDTTGSYNAALIPAINTYLVGALLIWKLPRPKLPSREADPTAVDASTGE